MKHPHLAPEIWPIPYTVEIIVPVFKQLFHLPVEHPEPKDHNKKVTDDNNEDYFAPSNKPVPFNQ